MPCVEGEISTELALEIDVVDRRAVGHRGRRLARKPKDMLLGRRRSIAGIMLRWGGMVQVSAGACGHCAVEWLIDAVMAQWPTADSRRTVSTFTSARLNWSQGEP